LIQALLHRAILKSEIHNSRRRAAMAWQANLRTNLNIEKLNETVCGPAIFLPSTAKCAKEGTLEVVSERIFSGCGSAW
jgi:hypothetical protein